MTSLAKRLIDEAEGKYRALRVFRALQYAGPSEGMIARAMQRLAAHADCDLRDMNPPAADATRERLRIAHEAFLSALISEIEATDAR